MKKLNTYKQFLNEKVSDEEVFSYLNDLRDSGQTNMFGAGAYIEKAFNLDKRKARDLLTKWMKSFDEAKVNEASANSYKSWRSKQSPNELEQIKSAIAGMSNEDYWKFGDWVLGEFIGLNPPHNDGDIMDKPETLDDWLTGQVSNKPAWKLIVQQLRKQRAL